MAWTSPAALGPAAAAATMDSETTAVAVVRDATCESSIVGTGTASAVWEMDLLMVRPCIGGAAGSDVEGAAVCGSTVEGFPVSAGIVGWRVRGIAVSVVGDVNADAGETDGSTPVVDVTTGIGATDAGFVGAGVEGIIGATDAGFVGAGVDGIIGAGFVGAGEVGGAAVSTGCKVSERERVVENAVECDMLVLREQATGV